MKRVFFVWLLNMVERYEKEIGDGIGNQFFDWCLNRMLPDVTKEELKNELEDT